MGNGFSFFTGNSAATVDGTPDKPAVPSPTIESKQEQDTNPAAAKSPKQASHGAREKRVVSAAKADAKHKQTTAAKRGKKTDLDMKWDNQCKELQKFQKKTGHCLVPFHYDANPSLGLWVSNQRCRKDKLSEDRLDLQPIYISTVVRGGLYGMPISRKTEISDADLQNIIAYLTRQR